MHGAELRSSREEVSAASHDAELYWGMSAECNVFSGVAVDPGGSAE